MLRTEAAFHWAIGDDEDTTVRASTHCAYDRIVLHGQRCQSLLRAAAAFPFPSGLGLTEMEVKGGGGVSGEAPWLHTGANAHLHFPQALNISDHYPVEVELSGAVAKLQPLGLATLLLPLVPLLGAWCPHMQG